MKKKVECLSVIHPFSHRHQRMIRSFRHHQQRGLTELQDNHAQFAKIKKLQDIYIYFIYSLEYYYSKQLTCWLRCSIKLITKAI